MKRPDPFTRLLLKEYKLILAAVLLSLALFCVYLFAFYIPYYFSSAKLFVRNIHSPDVVTPYTTSSIIQSESGFSNPLFNIIQILTSTDVADRTYDYVARKYPADLHRLGINNRNEWAGQFSELVGAKIEPSTDVIKVSLRWSNENHVQDILNFLVISFKDVNLDIRKSVETNQRTLLDEQLESISRQLKQVRQKMKEFKANNIAVNLEEELSEVTKARVDLEKQAAVLKSQMSYNNAKKQALSQALNMPNAQLALRATAIGDDPYLVKLNQDLALAEQRYAEFQAKFTDNYPDVIAIKNQIASLRENISSRKAESMGKLQPRRGIYDDPSKEIVTEFARTEAETASLGAQLRILQSGINQLRQQELQFPAKSLSLDDLRKDEEALATAFNNAKQKQLEARIKESQVVDNIITIRPPSNPQFMITPLFIKLLGFLMLGTLAGFAAAYGKEMVQDTWLDTDEIESVTGQKVLGVIPWMKDARAARESLIKDIHSPTGVAYFQLAKNLAARSYHEEAQVIAFVSTMPVMMNSVILTRLSSTLARSNRSILLIDTDFNQPRKLLDELGIEKPDESKGLLSIIELINHQIRFNEAVQEDQIVEMLKSTIVRIPVPNGGSDKYFSYLAATRPSDNIYDYVDSKGFKQLLTLLKKHFEFIFIDTPAKPFDQPEFLAITEAADAMVLISALETNREKLLRALNIFKSKNRNILGIITRSKETQASFGG